MPGARVAPPTGRSTPSTDCNCSEVTPPTRRTRGGSEVQSTIVDSTPTVLAPPSRTSGTSSPSSARTAAAVVGLTRPNRFADGAASPPPNAASSSRATGCPGTRRPTVSRPPVTSSGTAGRARDHQGQRTGPERRGQRPRRGRDLDRPVVELRRVAEVDDHGMLGAGGPSPRRGGAVHPGSRRRPPRP